MIPPETSYAVAPDGVHIAYQINGRPAGHAVDLVMMQGAVGHLEIAWEDSRLTRLFERLGGFSRLIRFDRRGMGMSDVLKELPTFEQQVEDFRTVMDAAESERAALMGTIDAGTLALAFAAEHPERTSAVVAFESAPLYAPSPGDDFGVDPEMLGRMAAASEAIDMTTHISIVAPSRAEEAGFASWFSPLRAVRLERHPDPGLHGRDDDLGHPRSALLHRRARARAQSRRERDPTAAERPGLRGRASTRSTGRAAGRRDRHPLGRGR